MVKFQEDNIMRNVLILSGILFSVLLNSQIKLNNNSIDSIITKYGCNCFDFYFDEKASNVIFSEVTKEEGIIPTKLSVSADDTKQLNEIIQSKKEYAYLVTHNYKFTFNGLVFYTANFRYDMSQYDNSIIKTQIENIKSICLNLKKRKFISPQKAESIARDKGLYNIFFQSIDNHYYGLNNGFIKSVEKDVWIFKEKDNNKTRVVIINAKNGKLLEDYYQ
ncbi:hypothetical protein [Cloacibacterium normanense]|uniref:hypothetical protein n=1 Tax=Cloacibacterium normanense TaxID=237258 RepID=UPI00391D3D5C